MPLDASPRFQMLELGTISSTNTFLKDFRPPHMADVTLVTAEWQTAGRGQTGHSWESDEGANLLFSLLTMPTMLPVSMVFLLSEAIALSIRDGILWALKNYGVTPDVASASDVTVKWPNDIYVGHKKIAGILIENEFIGSTLARSIIGCGVNVNQTEFGFVENSDDETAPPISVAMLTGRPVERSLILDVIIDAFRRRYDALGAAVMGEGQLRLHEEYLANLYRRQGMYTFADERGLMQAKIVTVDLDGHLVLSDSEGVVRRYAFKEVRYVTRRSR